MIVPAVTYPGSWLASFIEESDAAWHTQTLLGEMTKGLGDASIALALFIEEETSRVDLRAERDRAHAIREEASQQVRAQIGPDWTRTDRDRESVDTDVLAIKLATERGIWPRTYTSRVRFIHAQTFVYSLDAVAKALEALVKRADSPPGVATALDDWNRSLPTVRAIRDSAHHMEDRARGLRFGKPLDLQPVDNGLVFAPNGGVIVFDLIGNRFGATTESGHYEEVAIEASSLASAQTVVQAAIEAFEWTGPAHLEPSL